MKLELKTNFQEKSFIVQPGRTHSRRRQSLPHTERSCLFPHHLPLMQPERWRGQVSCGQDRWAGKRVAGNQHHALVSSLMTHLLDPAERPAWETFSMSPKVSANGHLGAGVQGKVLFLFTGNSTCEKKKKMSFSGQAHSSRPNVGFSGIAWDRSQWMIDIGSSIDLIWSASLRELLLYYYYVIKSLCTWVWQVYCNADGYHAKSMKA